MFCDLVGSTGISARLDAEEWRDLVSAYLDAATAAVAEMGGYAAKKLGDGLLALFDYPVAHENDAERAVRFFWSVVSKAASRRFPLRLQQSLMARNGSEIIGQAGRYSQPLRLGMSGLRVNALSRR
jgi:class 3 adenylate cyclase